MHIRWRLSPAVFTLLLALSPQAVVAQEEMMAEETNVANLHVDAETAEFTEVAPGVFKAEIWGDQETGPYGTFTRFEPGYVNTPHMHTNQIHIVVLEGAYVYTNEDGEETRVETGQFFSSPGGTLHVSGGDADEGALFYEHSQGGFDMVMADE